MSGETKKYHATLHRQKYSNHTILHPDGSFMCRCGDDRVKWYLDRELATIVQEDPLIVKLSFVPKGRGHKGQPYYEQRLKNRCVCCGVTKNLTSHHVVPHNFRRAMPENVKSSNHHDILPLCDICHGEYEKLAFDFKREIAAKYGVPINGERPELDSGLFGAKKAARALLKFRDFMSETRIDELEQRIAEYLGDTFDRSDLDELADLSRRARARERRIPDSKKMGFLVITQLDKQGIEDFVKMWRAHFRDFAKTRSPYWGLRRWFDWNPKYFPKHWSINHCVWRD